jgi:two-component system sensor histidine kinase/response regulator
MDGLEATRVIRNLPGCATLPIVAMTANAFDEDRERCYAAGMSDFIGKPVDPEKLIATVRRWLAVAPVDGHAAPAAVFVPADLVAIAGLDAERGLKLLNGHLAVYRRLLRRYAADHGDDVSRLRERLSARDRKEARRLAHNLKGSSGNLGLVGVQRIAGELETAIRNGADPAILEPQTSALESELTSVCAAIIANVLDEDVITYAGQVDFDAVRTALAALAPLLAAADIQANEVFATHAPLLKAALGASGAEIERHILNFAYADALETVQRALRETA